MFLQGSSSSQNGGSAPPAGMNCQGAPVGCSRQQTQGLRLGEQAGLLYQRQRQPIPLRQRQQPRLLRLGQQAQLLQSAQESRRSSSALALAQAVLATAKKTYRRELQAPRTRIKPGREGKQKPVLSTPLAGLQCPRRQA